MAFEYKCVAGPTIVAVKSARARDQAVKAFEDIMNTEAASGWEYVGIDEFHISEPEGWLSRKRVFVPSKILVFRRVKKGSAMAEALETQKLANQKLLMQSETPPLSIQKDMTPIPQPEGTTVTAANDTDADAIDDGKPRRRAK